ncbi:MAG TPA: molybdopterin-binding protein [Arenimonas sp.]|uniref:molybdopterin-binding protein n=1 Tax=Arenimonas sp. TaxID=1872635 RepID=UPI002C554C71|nr:molybdopterin-binding protein [Arenimonas sp.]HMB56688.1 molybdopterin-binding protein [Arenimonas sp.]
MSKTDRRRFLEKLALASGAVLLGACDRLDQSPAVQTLLKSADAPTDKALHALTPEDALAQEFTEADLSPVFKANGSVNPKTPEYLALLRNNFADYRLQVRGLVRTPLSLSLPELRALPSRTQITRHDCVEGWSCIGKWTGTPLGPLLDRAGPLPRARYVVFRCADSLDGDENRYYESIYLREAHHPQSILAYDLNGAALDVPHGAPLRLRVERKLGYKQAKYLLAIELVESLAGIGQGNGGYWEDDQGYQWHGGI